MTQSPAPRARELTARTIVLGLLLSAVMGAANVYVGLKVGMTVSASIPAAVVAMLIFRTFFKRSSVLEANQVQTAASAGESLAAGICFTMPALLVIGFWQEFDFWTVTAIAFAGGCLGILFMIPMRRVFVRDNDELPYPEGVACAAVLRAGEDTGTELSAEQAEESDAGARALIIGGVIGAVFKFGADFLGLVKGTVETAWASTAGRVGYIGTDVLPLLVGVGYLVGLNVAFLLFLGGALAWLVGMPLLSGGAMVEAEVIDEAWRIWSEQIRYLGVGAMVVGGAASIFTVRRGLVAAVKELRGGKVSADQTNEEDRDLPGAAIAALALLCTAIVAWIYWQFTQSVPIAICATLAMLVLSFFMTAVASYIVGLVGNSNSPVSGMTITAVLFTGAMLALIGFRDTPLIVATLGVAAVVCCVACTSGDVCNDLKTGHMVGASPRRQQMMQVLGVAMASVCMQPVLQMLHEAEAATGGIGGKALPAPQAKLMADLTRGLAGQAELPWNLIGWGAGIGVLFLIADAILERRKAKFRLHLMPIAVGAYLPFGIAPPILIGGLIAWFAARHTRTDEEREMRLQRGVLFSSGIIAGEALMGVVVALLAVRSVDRESWPWLDGMLPGEGSVQTVFTVVAACFVLGMFFWASREWRSAGKGHSG